MTKKATEGLQKGDKLVYWRLQVNLFEFYWEKWKVNHIRPAHRTYIWKLQMVSKCVPNLAFLVITVE